MKKVLQLFAGIGLAMNIQAMEYSLVCGELSQEPVSAKPALLLSGGADGKSADEKPATQWLLSQAPKGDYLVIRSGGVGKQAKWICNNFAEYVNSASEISIDSAQDANLPAVIELIKRSEIIWIAGGDQTRYSRFFKSSLLADVLNVHMKNKPIGGTSAGMAILGGYYYAPKNEAVIGSQLLNNPFHVNSQDLFHGDLLNHPFLKNVFNETHVDRKISGETRHSRVFGMLARMSQTDQQAKAIALYEGSFVAINELGKGKVFGKQALFLQALSQPERLLEQQALVWNHQGKAVRVFSIPGTPEGNGEIDFKKWEFNSIKPSYWYTQEGYLGLNTPL